jgi:hypothetical protein
MSLTLSTFLNKNWAKNSGYGLGSYMVWMSSLASQKLCISTYFYIPTDSKSMIIRL